MDSTYPSDKAARPGTRSRARQVANALGNVGLAALPETSKQIAADEGFDGFVLKPADIRFLLLCRAIEFGEITLKVAAGSPATIVATVENVDLSKEMDLASLGHIKM